MTNEQNQYCKCLYYSANALAREITRMAEEEFSVVNLAPSYAFIVMTVNRQPGIQAGELAEIMMLTPSTITRLLEKLELQTLVTRQTEGRVTRIIPTDKSMEMNDLIKAAWYSLYKRYTGILGEEHSKHITEELFKATLVLKK